MMQAPQAGSFVSTAESPGPTTESRVAPCWVMSTGREGTLEGGYWVQTTAGKPGTETWAGLC